MKKVSKLLTVLLILIMTLSFVACGKDDKKDDDTKTPGNGTTDETPDGTDEPAGDDVSLDDIIPEETVTLNVYTQLANYSGEQIGWFAQVMKEKFNVVLNIINEGDGTFVTRMESGDLGDMVVFGNDADEYIQAINAGMLFDWEEDELIDDYGPYILEHMGTALDKNKSINPDGKLYGFGHNVGTSATDYEPLFYRPDVRWDLYKELGYPEVATLEDFVGLLDEMVKIEPTSDTGGKTYGASLFPDWDGDMVMLVKSTGALYGYDEFGFGLYDVHNQVWEDTLMEGGMYLRALKFYNSLNQKGLLDPDSMTQTYDDMSEAYQTGAAFWNPFDWMASGLYNTPDHLAEGKAMMPLAAKDQRNLTYGLNIYGSNRVWTIGSKTDHPELVMAIINWLSTPEGFMTMEWGPKGVIWDYNEEGNPFLTELGEATMADSNTEMTDGFSGKYTDGTSKINNQTWARASRNPDASNNDPFNYSQWETFLAKPVSEIEQDWRNFAGANSATDYIANNGQLAISIGTQYTATPKSDELKTIWAQVAETIKTYSWRAIYAKTDAEFDTLVGEMRSKANDYGYDQCLEYQENEVATRKGLEDAAKASSN